jgi:3,4-dihydroxyphenylacetate 2,3-dioxygenase
VRDGLVEQGRLLGAARPDVIHINSCYLSTTVPVVVDGAPRHRGVLTAQEAPELIHGAEYSFPGDYGLAAAIVDRGRAAGELCTLARDVHYLLDHGAVMPLVCYLDTAQRAPTVPVSPCLVSDLDENFRWGRHIAAAVRETGRRAAFVASGSVSHKLVRGPETWPTPRDQALDHRLASRLADGDYAGVAARVRQGGRAGDGRPASGDDARRPPRGGTGLPAHVYGPSSGSGNHVLSLTAS